jgi:hypothetical protein
VTFEAPAVPQDPSGHYAALGLSSMLRAGVAPSTEDLRAAYRRLALQLHPDRQMGKPLAAQKKVRRRLEDPARDWEGGMAVGRRPLLPAAGRGRTEVSLAACSRCARASSRSPV